MEVKIHIKDPILRAYLAGLFAVREDGGYTLNTDSITGTTICSLVQPADYPDAIEAGKDTVTFHLPRSRSFDRFRNRSLRLSSEAEVAVNKVLRREFDLNLDASCTEARMAGVKLMDAIEAFIVSNRMDEHFAGGIETLKNRDLQNLLTKNYLLSSNLYYLNSETQTCVVGLLLNSHFLLQLNQN